MGSLRRTRARVDTAHDLLDHVARPGLVAYGAVHLLIGWLALQLAFGDRSGSASSSGALRELSQQPFGQVLVWLVAAGLALLTLWQVVEAWAGHRTLQGGRRLRKRGASAGKALVYGYLGFSAARVAAGSGASSGTDSMTGRLMDLPGGQLLVGAVAVVVIVIGGYLVWNGLTEGFREDLSGKATRGGSGTAIVWLGKVGYVAKGIALGIVGALFGYAAATHDANRSGGLDQALQQVVQQPFGPVLLAAIAAGIGCFGVFCFAHARHLSR